MKTSEVLNRTADWFQTNPWDQGDGLLGPRMCGKNADCLVSGLGKVVVVGSSEFDLAVRALNAYLGSPPFVWNDVPGRTVEDVIVALRCTALLEMVKEAPEFVIPAHDEAWLRRLGAHIGTEPTRIGDRLYLTRRVPGLSEALVYSARVEVDAR